MKTVYLYSKNIWAINSGLLFFAFLFIAAGMILGFGGYAKGWNTAVWLFIPVPFILIQIFYNLMGRMIVNDKNLLIRISAHHKSVSILQISSVDKVMNKKGKVRKLVLHVHPERTFSVAPYDAEAFIKQITKLNPRIQINTIN